MPGKSILTLLVARLGQGDPGADRGRSVAHDPQAHVRQHRHPASQGNPAARPPRDGKDAPRAGLRQANRRDLPEAGGPATCAGAFLIGVAAGARHVGCVKGREKRMV